jgi:dihydrofolate synthase / folylpolyglutamate synthase
MNARLEAVVARLDALVNWERRERGGMRVGLDPMRDLAERLGHPERAFRALHVTGTKGKGTTSALVAAALTSAGLRTGTYSSPHVDRIHERIRVDGVEIEDDDFADALEEAFDAREAAIREDTPADDSTWFDLVTAAAFLHFARARCAWAVIEVGIGGRLDSTNVVDGEVAIVTNVELEHVNVLGSTRAAIAREKAGIVKPGATLVTSLPVEDEAGTELAARARELGVPVLRPASRASTMLGRNLDLARLALDELARRGVAVSAASLDDATIERARLPGRLEHALVGGTRVVLDGAHVAASVADVLEECSRDPRLVTPPVVVLALGRDKDAPSILKVIGTRADRLVCTTVASGPLRSMETLAEEASRAGIAAETAADPTVALARAISIAGTRTWVLVIGSFHLVGAVRSRLAQRIR